MGAGLPDLVDCMRLATDSAVLRRVYELGDMARLQGVLADARGALSASFAFSKLPSGRPGAEITVEAVPQLVCQRCMQGFSSPVAASSEVEFATAEEAVSADGEREFFMMHGGQVSLRDLAEEELLLALPIAPACSTPLTCGHAPNLGRVEATMGGSAEMRRPFSALQDLLKKT